jgi:3-dehydroquinate dehydratase/shikimate dehydrogenase
MPTCQLCVSLMPETIEQARAGLAGAAKRADLGEIRLDALRDFDPSAEADSALRSLIEDRPCPVIITYRPKREGGRYDGPEEARLEVLRLAARLGADYIDVEFDAVGALGEVPGRRIVSRHDLKDTPDDLQKMHEEMAATGADVVKVAVTANHILDTVPVLRVLKSAKQPTIALAMGERGMLTRVLAPKYGAALTYAPLEGQSEAGPGQVPLDVMLDLYRVDRIGPKTRVYGVIGDPVAHSMSPAIHNAAFAETGLDAVYLSLWVEGDAVAFVRAMAEFGFDGYSVTIPHKQGVMEALDEIEPVARRIGAVNTVERRPDGTHFGTNTDWSAGIAAIEAVVGKAWLDGKRGLIVGAGGVGRAMAFALKQAGARLTLADLDGPRAESLAAEVGAETCPLGEIAGRSADILLNCTPVGMHPKTDASPVPPEMLHEDLVVYDAVYNPSETQLLREAREAGCRTVAGIDHFVRQAVEQFELWAGRAAPVETMRRVVLQALKR